MSENATDTETPRGNESVTPDQVRSRVKRLFHRVNVSLIEWDDIANDLLGAATRISDLERQLAEATAQYGRSIDEMMTERDEARKQLAEAREQLSKNEEDEARLCPEDQSWQETLNTAREQLAEWRTLTTWGGTPEIINDFIKGQQTRIHAAQNAEEREDWKTAGMRIGFKLVAAGCKSDGIVDGVKEIIEQRDSLAEALWFIRDECDWEEGSGREGSTGGDARIGSACNEALSTLE